MDQATDPKAAPLASPSPRRGQPLDVRLRRFLVLAILLLGGLTAYWIALSRFDVQEVPLERRFGAEIKDAGLSVYLQPMQVDTTNGAMDVRISILQPTGDTGIASTSAKRDMRLMLLHDGRTEQLEIRTGRPLPESSVRLYLQSGSVRDYPLDRYRSLIRVMARGSDDTAVPIHLATWEGILGFVVRSSELAHSNPSNLEISFDVQRSGAFAFFGLVAYGAMIVMGLSALAIGAIVFIGVRAIEAALVGAIASMVFALFGMRQALPSAPPLGIRADVLVFFWAQLASALALCLMLVAWVSRGPRPPVAR